MNYIEKKDDKWHKMSEVTPSTKNVIFKMKNGRFVKGEIVVEMSGFYYYQRDEPEQWLSKKDIEEWKFR